MQKLRLRNSLSLDGFVAGPNQSLQEPLGIGGERLHEWVTSLEAWRRWHGQEGGEVNESPKVLEAEIANIGHHMGRKMFGGGPTFTFVTDGIQSALQQARRAAGQQDVALAGGAQTAQQYLNAGLVDEMQLHQVPTL